MKLVLGIAKHPQTYSSMFLDVFLVLQFRVHTTLEIKVVEARGVEPLSEWP